MGHVIFNPYPTRSPWECPRCGVMNAPHVDRCTCPKAPTANAGSGWTVKTYEASDPDPFLDNHNA